LVAVVNTFLDTSPLSKSDKKKEGGFNAFTKGFQCRKKLGTLILIKPRGFADAIPITPVVMFVILTIISFYAS
jgi:hypothetical protein